jgi:hypothetical protein
MRIDFDGVELSLGLEVLNTPESNGGYAARALQGIKRVELSAETRCPTFRCFHLVPVGSSYLCLVFAALSHVETSTTKGRIESVQVTQTRSCPRTSEISGTALLENT